jgi:uncharacterized protein
MQTLCIYHANCFDGIAAAWVVKRFYEDAICIPMQYGQDIIAHPENNSPVIINKNTRLVVVDFSFDRNRMIALHKSAGEMIVLDHHKTAQANCEGLDFCHFDMEQSGAGLAWRWYYPNGLVPYLIKYIEDRDLWRFKLLDSKAVNAFIQSFPMTLDNYEYLYHKLESRLQDAVLAGEAVERYKDTMVAAICKHAVIKKIGEWYVPVVQAGILMSEIGHYLASHEVDYAAIQNLMGSKNHITLPPFAASYFIRNDGMTVYSLRSIGDFDVSAVAKQYGGGGHKNAAGFQILGELKDADRYNQVQN